jgi:hypothetical protein
MPYTFGQAHRLMLSQTPDGRWGDALLSTPPESAKTEFAGVGTVAACHRLIEYGWEKEAPPLAGARRLLFRLLAEDDDGSLTFEFAKDGSEPETIARSRGILRQAAAAVLAHAGYEGDPRLRGAANRMLSRIHDYIVSPLAESPWIKVGGKPVLAPEAFPPTYHSLVMLAFMPHYRNEHHEVVDRLAEYLARPMPKHEPVQAVGLRALPNPFLVLGDPLSAKGMPDADIGFTLFWLEIMARLGVLRRHEGWNRAFERLLDDRDHDFVWRPRRTSNLRSVHPMVWPFFPLQNGGSDASSIDVTFRLGLIARLSGRTIDLV